jgi:hypothetical protein
MCVVRQEGETLPAHQKLGGSGLSGSRKMKRRGLALRAIGRRGPAEET